MVFIFNSFKMAGYYFIAIVFFYSNSDYAINKITKYQNGGLYTFLFEKTRIVRSADTDPSGHLSNTGMPVIEKVDTIFMTIEQRKNLKAIFKEITKTKNQFKDVEDNKGTGYLYFSSGNFVAFPLNHPIKIKLDTLLNDYFHLN
jgi:hypothetical protein